MSLVKQVILNADEELRYPTPAEIHMIQNFCHSGEQRIRIATTLAKNQTRLVEQASDKFWKLCPITPSNSGNMRKTASCQRDQGWYIRLVAYWGKSSEEIICRHATAENLTLIRFQKKN
jgi:allophycocyanin-B